MAAEYTLNTNISHCSGAKQTMKNNHSRDMWFANMKMTPQYTAASMQTAAVDPVKNDELNRLCMTARKS
jgi:hypothetical protein